MLVEILDGHQQRPHLALAEDGAGTEAAGARRIKDRA